MHSTVFIGVEICINRDLLPLSVSRLGSLDTRASDSGLVWTEGRRIDSRAGPMEVLAFSWGLD